MARLPNLQPARESELMRVVHMGLWRVKDDADPAIIRRAQEKVANFTETVPGCIEALVAPLYVPEMGAADRETFGNLAGFEEMARGYNYILYMVFESEMARDEYEDHPAHMALKDECLALWVGDASEAALVFDLRLP
jgi:Stress responsive A/B Barrel Domain